MRLDELLVHASVRGILPDALITVVSVQWFVSEALDLSYKTLGGKVANELIYRRDETRIELVELRRPWTFNKSSRNEEAQLKLQAPDCGWGLVDCDEAGLRFWPAAQHWA